MSALDIEIPIDQMSFEDALSTLRGHVEVLARGEVPLAEAMSVFRASQALTAHCGALLDAATAQFEELPAEQALRR